MRARHVDVELWRSFLETFSRTHQGWAGSLEVRNPGEPSRIEVDTGSFRGARLETQDGRDSLIFLFGDEPEERFASMLRAPRSLVMDEQEDGSRSSLIVEGNDGTRAVLLLTRSVETLAGV